MNRLIWFFGCSACGKETLIKHIYNRQNEKLNFNLGIDLERTIILDKSIEYISKHSNDNMTEKRIEIVHDIITLRSKNDNMIVLIKGQNSDIRNNFIEINISNEHKKFKWVNYEEAMKLLKWDSNKNALWELNERLCKDVY